MKVLLNIGAEVVPYLSEWQECEGVRLVEQKDGSFQLELTDRLAAARTAAKALAKAEAETEVMLNRMHDKP